MEGLHNSSTGSMSNDGDLPKFSTEGANGEGHSFVGEGPMELWFRNALNSDVEATQEFYEATGKLASELAGFSQQTPATPVAASPQATATPVAASPQATATPHVSSFHTINGEGVIAVGRKSSKRTKERVAKRTAKLNEEEAKSYAILEKKWQKRPKKLSIEELIARSTENFYPPVYTGTPDTGGRQLCPHDMDVKMMTKASLL